MKSAHLFCLIVCLLFAAFAHAQDNDDPAKLEQKKQLILKDVKKACAPQRKQSDSEWQAMIMSSEANKLLMRNAMLAVDRNNQEAYWDAISRMDCMEDY